MRTSKTSTARYTLFDMPVVSSLLGWLAVCVLTVFGWKRSGKPPDHPPKCVMIAAPHTSNWDLPVMLMIAFAVRARVFWMGKHTLFRPPFGSFFRWLGGVPVDRRKSSNVVDQMVELFEERESFTLILAPEGTRKRTTHWKTGFYHIAYGAGVPIVLGFLDYERKVGGIGPVVMPTGDIEADMDVIRKFYADITGRHSAESSGAHVATRPPD